MSKNQTEDNSEPKILSFIRSGSVLFGLILSFVIASIVPQLGVIIAIVFVPGILALMIQGIGNALVSGCSSRLVQLAILSMWYTISYGYALATIWIIIRWNLNPNEPSLEPFAALLGVATLVIQRAETHLLADYFENISKMFISTTVAQNSE